jgi:transcriptional regulatory protein LevR
MSDDDMRDLHERLATIEERLRQGSEQRQKMEGMHIALQTSVDAVRSQLAVMMAKIEGGARTGWFILAAMGSIAVFAWTIFDKFTSMFKTH